MSETLAKYSTIGVGGPADELIILRGDFESAVSVLDAVRPKNPVILGGCSNVIISDSGVDRPVVMVRQSACEPSLIETRDGVEVTVSGTCDWDALVKHSVENGLAGLEFLSGIPGTVGAAPIQNVNAYGHSTSDCFKRLRAYDMATGKVETFDASRCEFAYRDSVFRHYTDRYVILEVTFSLTQSRPMERAELRYGDLSKLVESEGDHWLESSETRRDLVIKVRSAKSMVINESDAMSHSVGSFFVNPVVDHATAERLAMVLREGGASEKVLRWFNNSGTGDVKVPAATLLLASGFANGDRWGNVCLSEKHVLALVNLGGATAADVWMVANHVRHTVIERLGVRLEFEPRFIGPFPEFSAEKFSQNYELSRAEVSAPAWLS